MYKGFYIKLALCSFLAIAVSCSDEKATHAYVETNGSHFNGLITKELFDALKGAGVPSSARVDTKHYVADYTFYKKSFTLQTFEEVAPWHKRAY